MASNNIKLIVTDLDDTLLRRDKSISEYTKSVFGLCRKKGVLIAFATARMEKAAERFSRQITPDIFISNMGALARQGSKVLYKAAIPPDVVSALIKECLSDPRFLQITLQADKGYFNSEPIIAMPGWEDYSHSITTDFSQPIDYGDVYKITVRTDGSQAVKTISENFPTIDATGYRHESWSAFHARDASKEKALAAVAVALNIHLKNVAVFGDDTSDIDILRSAGIGVAVQNAIPEVKAVADYVCGDCDKDGVARWIEENILEKGG